MREKQPRTPYKTVQLSSKKILVRTTLLLASFRMPNVLAKGMDQELHST